MKLTYEQIKGFELLGNSPKISSSCIDSNDKIQGTFNIQLVNGNWTHISINQQCTARNIVVLINPNREFNTKD